MKKIYIAGCGGMLGEAFYTQFKDEFELKCTDIDLNSPWISFMDIRDFEAYRQDVLDFKADYLFHLGAYTDLEVCEKNPDEAYRTNSESVENAVNIANELNITLLFISTACIFDGKKENYDESDAANPIGIYAKSKYLGEKYVLENAKKYLVCRAGWMMGGGQRKDKKFIGKIMKQIENGKEELFIVNDKNGTPTFTHDFAKNVKLLIEKEYWGLFNMACEGLTSRMEVAKEMVKLLDLEEKVKITPVNSDFFSSTYFAVRPPSERLENRKLKTLGVNIMPHWSVSLKDYLENHFYKSL